MRKTKKIKILKKAIESIGCESSYLEDFDEIGERVDDPILLFERCIEEAYKEGLADFNSSTSTEEKK